MPPRRDRNLSFLAEDTMYRNRSQYQSNPIDFSAGLLVFPAGHSLLPDFDTWKNSPSDSARLVWESKTERIKLSTFAEEFFRRLGAKLQRPMLLRKGELHRLVKFVEAKSISNEVAQKLDALKILLTRS